MTKTIANSNISESDLQAWIPSVLSQTAAYLRGKSRFDAGQAEEFAAVALEYALKPYLSGQSCPPARKEDLLALTLFKAKNLAKDHFRREQRNPVKTHLDAADRGMAEDAMAESCLIQRASFSNWREQVRENERKAFAAELYARLDELCARIHLSDFRRDVFKAAYLQQESAQAVGARFGIKPNYVYNIVFNTKAALAQLAAELGEAA